MQIIDPKDISVVVRGLVVGSPESDERLKYTKRSLASIRKYLPGAQIILSTWKESDVSGLDYDQLVFSDPPRKIGLRVPDGSVHISTTNNQIITSRNGLDVARGKYAISMRSDIILTSAAILKYFAEYNQDEHAGIFKRRVLVFPTFNPRKKFKFLFDVCDWFYFGTTEDLRDIFDIPLMDDAKFNGEKIDGYHRREDNFESEQYIWINVLKKHEDIYFPRESYFSEKALAESERSYAQNTIMVPAQKAGLKCLKMPNAAYGARPILSPGLYTFNEYKALYNRYNAKKVPYIYNPFESFVYWCIFHLRESIGSISPTAYKRIVNAVRRVNGNKNLIP